MKILFIVPYTKEGQSNRLRVEQFLPYLRERGIQYKLRPFVFKRFYEILYLRGNYVKKLIFFLYSLFGRLIDIGRLIKYDAVFIHREACPFGPPFFEWIAYKIRKRIIFDFDDAIYLPSRSISNNLVEQLKNPAKVPYIIKISDRVIAGNSFLSDFATRFNSKVSIIPTCIDTETYCNTGTRHDTRGLTIGWIGSSTTVEYVDLLRNVLKILMEKYHNLNIKIIGGEFKIDGVNAITNKKWRLESEISDLKSIDIGVMPMPDNDWTRGKCGFKALLYMSLQIPCVCSPVGVNRHIIQDGVNGFLASSEKEWVDKLSFLIESEELRKRIGCKGRKTVEERYSVKLYKDRYLQLLEEIL